MVTRWSLEALLLACTLVITSHAQAINQTDIDTIVSLHNSLRSKVSPIATDMMRVEWDAGLATSAQTYADSCPSAHSGLPDLGENLSWGWPTMTAQEAVDEWIKEGPSYSFDANTCQPGKVCAHYTQMIWSDSAKVGCGRKSCPNLFGNPISDAWVCHYSPPGNYVGEKPYAAGPTACSACPNSTGCMENLCSPGGGGPAATTPPPAAPASDPTTAPPAAAGVGGGEGAPSSSSSPPAQGGAAGGGDVVTPPATGPTAPTVAQTPIPLSAGVTSGGQAVAQTPIPVSSGVTSGGQAVAQTPIPVSSGVTSGQRPGAVAVPGNAAGQAAPPQCRPITGNRNNNDILTRNRAACVLAPPAPALNPQAQSASSRRRPTGPSTTSSMARAGLIVPTAQVPSPICQLPSKTHQG